MRDRAGQILRVVCLVLVALVLVRLLGAGCHVGALVGVKIPPVPALETNSVSSTNTMTNAMVVAKGSNSPPVKTGAANSPKFFAAETPAAVINTTPAEMEKPVSTNQVSMTMNSPVKISVPARTNSIADGANFISATNAAQNGTNGPSADTNSVAGAQPPKKSRKNPPSEMAMAGGMESGGFPMLPGMPGKAEKLPPEIQARVDEIVDSEIFAPVMHPLPMALMGIAGDTAFLRTASGQTGLVKEGDSLGEIKLLRIGINRVLVEQDGQKKELTIFDGYGGESLLPQPNESSK